MNQSINSQASESRDLSLDELDRVSGGSGNMFDFGIIRLTWWKDGAFSIGLKAVGEVGYYPETGIQFDR